MVLICAKIKTWPGRAKRTKNEQAKFIGVNSTKLFININSTAHERQSCIHIWIAYRMKASLTIDECVALVHFQSFAIFEPVDLWRWISGGTALHHSSVTNFNDSCLWTLCNNWKTTRCFITCKKEKNQKNMLFIKMEKPYTRQTFDDIEFS